MGPAIKELERAILMQAEIAARQAFTGSVREQEAAVERARIVHGLLNDAQRAGLSITPQLRAEAEGLADAYVSAQDAARGAQMSRFRRSDVSGEAHQADKREKGRTDDATPGNSESHPQTDPATEF